MHKTIKGVKFEKHSPISLLMKLSAIGISQRKMREASTIISISSDSSDSEGDHPRPTKPAFFACYLLCSLRPRCKATYVGFTANPCRRIRQHNGVIKNGARQTKEKRPWEMVLCVYGFPSKASALKFEWAWRHPTRSVAVKKAAACLKSSQGTARKIELVYTMLTLTEWKDLNLTVNFLSTKHVKYTKGCPPLPSHMMVQICPMDELPCYQGTCGSSKGEHFSSGSGPEKTPQMFNGEMHQNISSDLVKQNIKIKK